jgi:lipopolysaccharide transport system ATP-binding protein
MTSTNPGGKRTAWRRPTRRPLPASVGRLARRLLGPSLQQIKPGRKDELLRVLTSRARVLPDFLIIGTQKGGTTSLFYWLSRHPNVGQPSAKEIEFFDQRYANGAMWYRAHFPTFLERSQRHRRGQGPFLTGEATPSYLVHPRAPQRVAELIPNVKLIALLRNPVDRAYSLYQHRVDQGLEPLSFEQAIEAEDERIRGEIDRIRADERYVSPSFHVLSYLYGGIYADLLEDWLRVFPRERLLVLPSEDLFSAPSDCFHAVLAFLGLPAVWEPHWYDAINAGDYEDKMSPDTRRRLLGYFGPHNERLASLVGRTFDWNA